MGVLSSPTAACHAPTAPELAPMVYDKSSPVFLYVQSDEVRVTDVAVELPPGLSPRSDSDAMPPSEKMMPKRSLSEFSDSDGTRAASKYCASDGDVSSLDSADHCAEERTTVRLCALPYSTDRATLLRILDRNGFKDKYDFVYVPIRFKTKQCLGFSFVNFTTAEVASEFRSFFDGYTKWEVKSHKVAHTDWSHLQGLEANRSHFKDHPLMHPAVEDRFKPALYHHGRRVSFPPPDKEAERTWGYNLRRRVPAIKSDAKASKPRERQWNVNAVSFAPACSPHALHVSSQIDAVLDALGC